MTSTLVSTVTSASGLFQEAVSASPVTSLGSPGMLKAGSWLSDVCGRKGFQSVGGCSRQCWKLQALSSLAGAADSCSAGAAAAASGAGAVSQAAGSAGASVCSVSSLLGSVAAARLWWALLREVRRLRCGRAPLASACAFSSAVVACSAWGFCSGVVLALSWVSGASDSGCEDANCVCSDSILFHPVLVARLGTRLP